MTLIFVKPAPVPRCRKPGHSSHVRGCEGCKAFSRFQRNRRVWEAANGIDRSPVPIGPVADHVEMLLTAGNWNRIDLAAKAGVGESTITALTHRRGRQTVLRDTADSLMAIESRAPGRPPQCHLVASLEAVRIARGLTAQGFTFKYLSQQIGDDSNRTVQKIATKGIPWVFPETMGKLRGLATRLGRFDLAQLDQPVPGMRVHAANLARRRGWVPLTAWRGQDMADPAATPWKIRPTGTSLVVPVVQPATVVDSDEGLPEVSPWSYIDPILTLRVADAAATIRKTDRAAGRRHDGFVQPVHGLTRLEAHALVEYAAAEELRTPDIACLLGYSMGTKRQISNAMRTVERMKTAMRKARATLNQLVAGNRVDPAWCFNIPNGNGFNDFAEVATALLAVQGEPFGPGWSPAELADRAGVGEGAMVAFLTYATRRGDAVWTPHEGTQQHPTGRDLLATDVEPVDLDLVLAAA